MKNSCYSKILVLLFLLGSCINGEQTYRANHTHLLSGGNSKVWLLEGTQQHANAVLKSNSWGEVLFIFYLTGEVLVGSFGDFDSGTYDKGHFYYNENKEQLTIKIGTEKWKFKLKVEQEDQLELLTVSGANLARHLHLIPLTLPH